MNDSTLFQSTVVFLIGNIESKVLDILKNGGATFSKFTMDNVTHVIVGKNFDESQVQEARELYEKPTVTEQWVLTSIKLGKLAPVKPYDPIMNGKLFSNCIFTMNQIDAQDRLKLYAMITFHGGCVKKELDNKVTHLLSGGSQSVALKVAALTKNKLTITTPDWVQECLKQKKLVDPSFYHPNLLISPMQQSSKITLMPTGGIREEKSTSLIRGQLQQNIRPSRPIIQTMQHTPQQINEIIQSQIQQQQMQEKAKQRAAAASTSNTQSSQQSSSVSTTLTTMTSNEPQQQSHVVKNVQQVSATQVVINSNQVGGNIPLQNVPSNQIPAINNNPVTQTNQITMQRQLSQQQLEANARNQKIQMISQHLQQSTHNQQQLLAQQQFKQFQNTPVLANNSNQQQQQTTTTTTATVSHMTQNTQHQQPLPQQQQQQQFSAVTQQQQNIQQGTSQVPQFTNQQMKQIITPNQTPQNQQQFILNQNQNQSGSGGGTVKTITTPTTGSNYIQIINQQGQQIIQIQHPESGQMQQKVINQAIHPNQQSAPQMHNIVTNTPPQANVQINQTQQQQQQQHQPNIIQGQGNRQNIVIINQVQNPQGMSAMALQQQQRFQQTQQQQLGTQQIIHQKIISSNAGDGIVQTQMQGNVNSQQNPQIIQVHQLPISGSQVQSQQTVSDGIIMEQKIQGSGGSGGAPNIVHVQQQQPQQAQSTQGLTQAQAVQQIAQQLQIPPGLTPQQQMQWLQQNQRRQIVIQRPSVGGAGAGGGPITQLPQSNQQANITQFQIDPNATPQQQQLQRQHFQRLQQLQQNQKMQSAEQVTGVEQSAAGTLRMMTAQHNAALNVQGIHPPGVVRSQQPNQQTNIAQFQIDSNAAPQPQIVGAGQTIVQTQQHPQLQQQRRQTLGNITNASGGVIPIPSSPVIVTNQIPVGAQILMPQAPSGNMKVQAPFSPGRAPPPITNRSQFYGHNPNLKLPADLFLLGCHFLIVEYDETNKDDLNDWKQSIKNHGGEIESCYNVRVTHVLCRTQKHGIVMQAIRDNKRCVTVYWLNDIILKKQVLPPWQAIHLPSSSVFGSMKPGMKHIITIMGFENDERERIKRMIEESGAKLTTYMNRQNTVVVCKRLDQNHKKFIHAKEFNIPMVNVVWLSDLLLGNTSTLSQYDSPKYQQYNLQQPLRIDHSIVPQLMNAWKAPINLTQEAHERVKRSQLDPPQQKAKKLRTIPFLETIPEEINCIKQPEPNNIPIVMLSQVDDEDGLTRAITILGGRVTKDHAEMTHLVMTKPSRTVKFLYALCRAKYIVNSSWLEESAKQGFFQNEDKFWIVDLGSSFKCNIPAVVKSPIRKSLFEHRVFYITPSVKPGPSFLKWIIDQCGGKWELNRRSVMKIHELNQQSPNSYIIISCPEDLHLLGFKHFVCYVCTSEFILQSLMTQTIDFLKAELQLTR
ncbi:CLUMA_CG000101, isoform A [Clunio marinus]|uniref:PAX-interacting protein 1 n=1 Tax=Clunio marinus TaxID=568069 RepID=A0A1J1HET3_9DIPT|nr:CLUMA_CG000101, isoform A [Clunio marinus]